MTVALALGRTGMFGSADYTPVSDSGRSVSDAWKAQVGYLRGTAIAWEPVVTASLRDIASTSSLANWDGFGATAVSEQTLSQTKAVLEALQFLLPGATPPPDISAESDGEICIDWTVDSNRTISISIGDQGTINFAARFGREGEVHAWQPVDTSSRVRVEEDLREVARYIRRVHSSTAASRS